MARTLAPPLGLTWQYTSSAAGAVRNTRLEMGAAALGAHRPLWLSNPNRDHPDRSPDPDSNPDQDPNPHPDPNPSPNPNFDP